MDKSTTKIRSYINNQNLLMKRRREIVLKSTETFNKKGYDRTSVDELAAAIGMTKGGLYRYIGSKDDILSMILDYMDQRVIAINEAKKQTYQLSPIAELRRAIKNYYQDIDGVRSMHKFFDHIMVNLPSELRSRIMNEETAVFKHFTSILERGVETGVFKIKDPIYIAHTILVNGHAWASRGWFLKKYYTLEQYTKRTTDSILKLITS